MSMLAGQALAFLKVGAFAVAIMAAIWVVVRVIEKLGEQPPGAGDGSDTP